MFHLSGTVGEEIANNMSAWHEPGFINSPRTVKDVPT